MFTAGAQTDPGEDIQPLRFINRVLRITPVRGPAQQALVRLAASLFVEVVPRSAVVNVAIGLPEEVCRRHARGPAHPERLSTDKTARAARLVFLSGAQVADTRQPPRGRRPARRLKGIRRAATPQEDL